MEQGFIFGFVPVTFDIKRHSSSYVMGFSHVLCWWSSKPMPSSTAPSFLSPPASFCFHDTYILISLLCFKTMSFPHFKMCAQCHLAWPDHWRSRRNYLFLGVYSSVVAESTSLHMACTLYTPCLSFAPLSSPRAGSFLFLCVKRV